MSYIGENVAVADFTKQTFTANSSTTVFTLSSSVANSSCLIVSVGGVIQEPDVAYTASGTTLTFSVAPTTGNDVYVIYIGKELPKTTHGDNTITNALIPDGVITNDKINSLFGSKLTGALPAIDGSALTGVGVNTDYLEDNIAMLGFKLAANNSLAKYNLVDRIIDEYQDGTGIDASASTNEVAGGTGTGKYYSGVAANTPTATGGTITNYGVYTIHTFTTSGDYINDTAQDIDYLVVAGGGGGGCTRAGGGGGGGFRFGTGLSVVSGTHSVTVGLGGVGGVQGAGQSAFKNGQRGGNSALLTITSTGGGGGIGEDQGGTTNLDGGSGGGSAGSLQSIGGAGNTPNTSPSQGNNGGNANYGTPHYPAGGGGGAGAVGSNAVGLTTAGSGGIGATNSYQTGSAIYYAGGGGGGTFNGGTIGTGGNGGGASAGSGNAVGPQGTNGLGGGGGGSSYAGGYPTGGAGGSGVVVIRRVTSSSVVGDLTLQSTANTASTAPTKGDITMLIEDAAGTAVLNTDIKAYVSRDGGSGWDQGTLTQEGTWGTNKKVLSFHDTTFSNSASGTDIRYKITTHNQSVSKETRIHATSLAWS